MPKKEPEKVSKKDIDDLWAATAKEVLDKRARRRPDPLLTQTDAQRRSKLAKAQEIVDRANAKKKK